MARVTAVALGSDPSMTETANAFLMKGGTSVDACIGGFFAAAGAREGVLLGSIVLLVGGTGAGAHVFDGSLVQPGKGAPRPRGFLDDTEIPTAAWLGVSTTGAVLAAAHAHGGVIPLSELATPGVRIARGRRAVGRANLLRRVGDAGPLAFREPSFTRSFLAIAGRPEGGNVTNEDLQSVQARVVQPHAANHALYFEPSTACQTTLSMQTIVVVACDHRGVLAAIHCTFDPDGVPVVPHEVTASKLACPVLRGVPRIRPGTPLGLPTPVALLTQRDVPWAAIGWEGMFVLPWDRLETQISLDLTVEQSLRALASETGNLRALVAVRGQRAGDEPRVYDLSPQSSGEPAWEEDVVEGETLSSR